MKIQRFFAADMRRTILKVRESMGPDAVILSNKRVEGGIEIVAALDYDDSMLANSSVRTNAETDTVTDTATEIEGTEEREVSREEVWNDVKLSRHIPEPVVTNAPNQNRNRL